MRATIALVAISLAFPALAQDGHEHHHPPQDVELHNKFYSTWMQPNKGAKRTVSCCNKEDCYPTQIELFKERFRALRREDGEWVTIPETVLEHNQPDPRSSPDTRSHVCMPKPGYGNVVYCAVLGSGQ